MRSQRGERVRGDLGVGVANVRKQRAFACIRITHEAGVRDFSQLKVILPLLPLLTFRELSWDAVAAALEMDVAFPTVTTLGEDKILLGGREISHQFELGEVDGSLPLLFALQSFHLVVAQSG